MLKLGALSADPENEMYRLRLFKFSLNLMPARRQLGFSLIELMITVAIIGLLSTLAVSKYDRQQAKARQSEAKVNLASIYSLEKSFFTEYGAYIPHFGAIGFSPEGDRRFYDLGWSGGIWAGNITGFNKAGAGSGLRSVKSNAPAGWTNCNASANLPNMTFTPWDIDDPQGMLMGAAGQIQTGSGCDVWEITENKVLRNTTIGY